MRNILKCSQYLRLTRRKFTGVQRISGAVRTAIQCDVTKDDDIERVSSEVKKLMNSSELKLWALVNNAGIAPLGYVDWMALGTFRKAMDTNYFGLVAMTKAMLPFIKRTRGARIVNVSSMAGLLASPGFAAYAATKHAVEVLFYR